VVDYQNVLFLEFGLYFCGKLQIFEFELSKDEERKSLVRIASAGQ